MLIRHACRLWDSPAVLVGVWAAVAISSVAVLSQQQHLAEAHAENCRAKGSNGMRDTGWENPIAAPRSRVRQEGKVVNVRKIFFGINAMFLVCYIFVYFVFFLNKIFLNIFLYFIIYM